MKRTMPWSEEEDDSSSDDSSTLDTDVDSNGGSGNNKTRTGVRSSQSSKGKISEVDSGKRRSKGVDFEALSRHGYKGGLSILGVPPPKEIDQKQDWSWSTGKKSRAAQEEEKEETFEERQRTRAAIVEGEQLTNVQTPKEKKNLSFAQKEKRKRDMGQASRGKNYVEEEKRMLRESGVYSGFDS